METKLVDLALSWPIILHSVKQNNILVEFKILKIQLLLYSW